MKLLSRIDCETWCNERGLRISKAGYVSFPETPFQSLVIPLPSQALRAVNLANLLSAGLSDVLAEGSLLWLKSWDIWSESYEEVGASLLHAIRRSQTGQDRDLREFPGQLFDSSESLLLRSSLLIPILFQWDAYWIPDPADYLVFVCHDRFVNVLTRSEAELEQLFEKLDGWGPKKEVPARIDLFVDAP